MTNSVSLTQLARLFLRLGITGFGGPLAHVALMRRELVEKRRWVSEAHFMDMYGAVQLIPGPNSTELAIHLGHHLAGVPGMIVAGICFILPAFLIVLGIAVLYQSYGQLPDLQASLLGVRPVIVAIVLEALDKFRRPAVPDLPRKILALMALVLLMVGLNEVVILFGLGILFMLRARRSLSFAPIPIFLTGATKTLGSGSLFLFFLKLGSVLFGSGYVLFAFLQNELVEQRHWLTSGQLLDAITVGQMTPGPVFTTATFIGYILLGYQGAILATIGIFLPSFVLVWGASSLMSKLRTSVYFRGFLDGVNAVSFAFLAKVCVDLLLVGVTTPVTFLIALGSFLILKFRPVNSAWLLLVGAFLGNFFSL